MRWLFVVHFFLSTSLLGIDVGDVWPRLSYKTKISILGHRYVDMPIDVLRQRETFDEIVKSAEEQVRSAKSITGIEEILAPHAKHFVDKHITQISRGWCQSFRQLYTLVDEFLPEDLVSARAFVRFLLYLQLGNISCDFPHCFSPGVSIQDVIERHKTAVWRYYLQGADAVFVCEEDPFFAMMAFLVGMAQGKFLFNVTTNLEQSHTFFAHGKSIQGLFKIFEHDEGHVLSIAINSLLLNNMHKDLAKKLAQGYLDTMREHWPTDGIGRAILGFLLLHEEGFGVHLLKPQPSIAARFSYFIANHMTILGAFDDEGMQQIIGEAFAVFSDEERATHEEIAIKGALDIYTRDALAKIDVLSTDAYQRTQIDLLRVVWCVDQDVEDDLRSYQLMVLSVVKEIFALDGEGYLKGIQDDVVPFLELPLVNKKVFFAIFDQYPKEINAYLEVPVVMLPLKESLTKMTLFERKCLLVYFLRTHMQFMGYHRSLLHFFPFDDKFTERLSLFCINLVNVLG